MVINSKCAQCGLTDLQMLVMLQLKLLKSPWIGYEPLTPEGTLIRSLKLSPTLEEFRCLRSNSISLSLLCFVTRSCGKQKRGWWMSLNLPCASCLELAHRHHQVPLGQEIPRVTPVEVCRWLEAHQGYYQKVHRHPHRMGTVGVLVDKPVTPQISALLYLVGKNVHYHLHRQTVPVRILQVLPTLNPSSPYKILPSSRQSVILVSCRVLQRIATSMSLDYASTSTSKLRVRQISLSPLFHNQLLHKHPIF